MIQYIKNVFLLILITGVFAACQAIPEPDIVEDETTLMSRGNSKRAQNREFGAFLTATEEVNPAPVTSLGVGAASFHVSPDRSKIEYTIKVSQIENVLFAHIHVGEFGVNGPVVVTLIPPGSVPSGVVSGVIGSGTITAANLQGSMAGQSLEDLISLMESGMTYVNVHTTQFPPGEQRGQISLVRPNENGNYTTQLSGSEEVPSNNSKARGVGIFKFNKDNTSLSYRVNVAQLVDVRFAHIHLGKKGFNGPVVVTLRGDRIDGRVNGVYAVGNITNNDLQGLMTGGDLDILREALRTGNAYVNVHTDKFPPGEIRGQL